MLKGGMMAASGSIKLTMFLFSFVVLLLLVGGSIGDEQAAREVEKEPEGSTKLLPLYDSFLMDNEDPAGRRFSFNASWFNASSLFNSSSLYNATYFSSYIKDYLSTYYSNVYNQTWITYPWYGPTAGLIDTVVMVVIVGIFIMVCSSSVYFAKYGYATGQQSTNRTLSFDYGDYEEDYGDYQDEYLPYLQRSTRSVMSALERLYRELNGPPS